MLLLKLHSEIVVPVIGAIRNSATDRFLLKKLGALLLKLGLLLAWRVRRCRKVAHCLSSEGGLCAAKTVVCSGRSWLMHQTNQSFLPLVWSGWRWQLGLGWKLGALVVIVLLQGISQLRIGDADTVRCCILILRVAAILDWGVRVLRVILLAPNLRRVYDSIHRWQARSLVLV